VKINFKKMLLQRYVLYPIIVGSITYLLLDFISATPMKDVMNQYSLYNTIDQMFGVRISFEDGQILYSYLVGFAFGTISQVTKHIKKSIRIGFVSLVITLIQYYMCFYLFSTIAFFVIPLEITVLLFIILIFGFATFTKVRDVKKA
jgi:hypothetical protein